MSVRIRLSRYGRKNRPFFRIEVFDSRTRRNGKSIEQIGWYDPLVEDEAKKFKLDKERAEYWLSQGVELTKTVHSILNKLGIYKKPRKSKKS